MTAGDIFLKLTIKSYFMKMVLMSSFIQDNQSKSSYGVIRGLHYQKNPFAQGKLVRVLEGKILDVAVDIRLNSPTYGQHFSIELSADNKLQLWIPAGFAHGFSVLSETAVVLYKCDHLYNKESEGGIKYDDKDLNIDWKLIK
jgi:dTDP-4-dehydrorhamnose 3,5-epimerase